MSNANLAAVARLDNLTLAIGEDRFGSVLVDAARSLGDADHLLIFAFPAKEAPRLVMSDGSMDKRVASAAADAYVRSLYRDDPHYPAIQRQPEGPPTWFEFDEGRGCGARFRANFFDAFNVSDILAFAVTQDKVVYYVTFLRIGGGGFVSAQRWLFRLVGEVLAATVRKHFSYTHALKGQHNFLIGHLLSEAPEFAELTPRERLVCLGILTGHTSESIALNLSISVNSVLTYRKRLYEKLNISSQNELFARVLSTIMTLGEEDLFTRQLRYDLNPAARKKETAGGASWRHAHISNAALSVAVE